jgi:hypothetical protein
MPLTKVKLPALKGGACGALAGNPLHGVTEADPSLELTEGTHYNSPKRVWKEGGS